MINDSVLYKFKDLPRGEGFFFYICSRRNGLLSLNVGILARDISEATLLLILLLLPPPASSPTLHQHLGSALYRAMSVAVNGDTSLEMGQLLKWPLADTASLRLLRFNLDRLLNPASRRVVLRSSVSLPFCRK